jgi:hypothetical protein
MLTIIWTRRRERVRRTGALRWVYDAKLKRGADVIAPTRQGYTRLSTASRVLRNVFNDIRAGRVRTVFKWKVVLVALCLASSALAVNSPRPSSFHADNGRLILVWTNLSEAHPWLLSYRTNMATPWLWDTTRLHAVGRALTVAIPMEEQQGFYRLWPAAPDQ